MPPVGHFPPSLGDDIDDLLRFMPAGKTDEIQLEKDQAGDILERLRLRIGLESLFADQRLRPRNGRLVVPQAAQDVPRLLGVEAAQRRPPLVLAGAGHRIRRAGDGPAAQVLASHRQPERF